MIIVVVIFMRKLVFSIILTFIFILNINAKEISVKFSECVDGDTAKFKYKDEIITARFLAIDTPETKHPKKGEEPFGKEASEYTCKKLKNAEKIRLEFDVDSDELDKYDRYLVWVFVDDELLQEDILKEGLAEVKYIYGDYKYLNVIKNAQSEAKKNQLNIWSNCSIEEDNILYTAIVVIVLIVIIIVFKPNKRTIKKLIKKYL